MWTPKSWMCAVEREKRSHVVIGKFVNQHELHKGLSTRHADEDRRHSGVATGVNRNHGERII